MVGDEAPALHATLYGHGASASATRRKRDNPIGWPKDLHGSWRIDPPRAGPKLTTTVVPPTLEAARRGERATVTKAD